MNQTEPLIDEVLRARRLLSAGRDIRKAAGVTQDRLARSVPVDRSTLNRWEAGAITPQGRKRARYLDLLEQLEQAAS